jgi:hypothetical protein
MGPIERGQIEWGRMKQGLVVIAPDLLEDLHILGLDFFPFCGALQGIYLSVARLETLHTIHTVHTGLLWKNNQK